MPELKLWVPTYYGPGGATPQPPKEEFDEPRVPVVVREAEGVRIVLGSHDYWDTTRPDIQIERRHKGWVIFLHPLGGCDPSGLICFLDDGRSFVVRESPPHATPPIKSLRWRDAVAEVDGIYADAERERDEDVEQCALCEKVLTPSGDNWDDLCPGCADQVSEYLDERDLTDGDRDDAIESIRRIRLVVRLLRQVRNASGE
jgi:hypothetical protein